MYFVFLSSVGLNIPSHRSRGQSVYTITITAASPSVDRENIPESGGVGRQLRSLNSTSCGTSVLKLLVMGSG